MRKEEVVTLQYDGEKWRILVDQILRNLSMQAAPKWSLPAGSVVTRKVRPIAAMAASRDFADVSRLSKGSEGRVFCCAGKNLVRDPNYDIYSCEKCNRRFDREHIIRRFKKDLDRE